jgi:hypothetical protein
MEADIPLGRRDGPRAADTAATKHITAANLFGTPFKKMLTPPPSNEHAKLSHASINKRTTYNVF